MIHHTLLFRFGTQTTPPERDAILQSLIALCDQVGEVTSLACGPNVNFRVGMEGFTHNFAVVFGDEAARDAFRALSSYAAVLERLSQAAVAVCVDD